MPSPKASTLPKESNRFISPLRPQRSASILLAIVLSMGAAVETNAEQLFEHIGQSDGLVNSSVSSIIEDDYGFLWFGTQAGLQRFDGQEFTLYTNEPFAENRLAHHLVQTLYYGGGDTIWVGTYGGLNRLNSATGEVTHYTYTDHDPESLTNDVVVSIARDRSGMLWVGTLDGLNRLDDEQEGRFTRFRPDSEDQASLPHMTVRALHLDSRDRLWVGTIDGLAQIRGEGDEIEFDPLDAELPSPAVMAIDEAIDGSLWLGTWDGGLVRMAPDRTIGETYEFSDNRLYAVLAAKSGLVYVATWGGGLAVVNPETGEIREYRADAHDPHSLAHDVVTSFHEQANGLVWIGTNGNGVTKLDPARRDYRMLHPDLPPDRRLPAGKVQTLFLDEATATLYVGIQQGGLHAYDTKSGTRVSYSVDPENPGSLNDDQINAVMRRGDRILVGTNSGIERLDPTSGEFEAVWHELFDPDNNALRDSAPIVYTFETASDGSLWVGTYDRGVYRRRPDGEVTRYYYREDDPASLSDNLIYEIYEDRTGEIWIGTNRGLNRYEAERGSFARYLYDPDNPSGITDNSVVHALEDSDDRLWFAMRSGGIIRYERESDSFSHLTMAEGLNSNFVRAVVESEPGTLYVATKVGMNRVDTHAMTVHPLSERDGTATREFNSGGLQLPDGTLVFGAFASVLKLTPEEAAPGAEPPVTQITGIRVMGEPYRPDAAAHTIRQLELNHTENSLAFSFAVLDFTLPDTNCSQYRLVGFHNEWSACSTPHIADYTNLPPGRYTFEVRGSANPPRSSHDAAFGPVTRVSVHIIPPFWRTPWFTVGLVALALVLIRVFLSARTRAFRAQNSALEQQVSERTLELSRAVEALHQTNATKDRFLSILSHDLRGPLSGITGLMDRIVSGSHTPGEEELTEIHSAVLETSRGLEGMLSNLLEWARLQSGRLSIDPVSIPVHTMLNSVAEAYHGAALAKQIQISVDCSEDLRAWVDVHRTHTILENLVNNAVKFTRSGTVVLSAFRAPENEHRVRISVADSGIGIPEERKEHLFDLHTAARTSGTAGERGSGVGLGLCRELVQLIGGTISVESETGVGTTVTVELPGDSG